MPDALIPLVILGPTATGKSDAAARVARRLGGRVINADSIQVYRGLNAGSCKPPSHVRDAVPHYLIDVADPREAFSAGRFARMAGAAMEECGAAGAVPIVAGGTGLYLRALLEGIAPMPHRDEALRARLAARARQEGVPALHAELAVLDAVSGERIGRNDLQRIVRALEVPLSTGRTLSQHLARAAFGARRIRAVTIGLRMERATLYGRIDRRVEEIFAAGIVDELQGLLRSGVPPHANALKALGYREAGAHLRGEITLARAKELTARNTRRFARRQMSWFAGLRGVVWLDAAPPDEGEEAAEALASAIARAWRTEARGPSPD